MENDQTPRPAEAPVGVDQPSSQQAAHARDVIGQLIALQRDQQATLHRFLDFESRLAVGGDIRPRAERRAAAGAGAAAVSAAAAAAPAADLIPPFIQPGQGVHAMPQAPAVPHVHPVPPAPPGPPVPELPAQILALHPAAGPGGPVMPAPAPAPAAPIQMPPPGGAAANGSDAGAEAAPAAGQGAGLVPTEEFKADLLQAAAERTGYPEDMLDLDAHMEADLGIDSIKRIEIFSQLKEKHNLMEGRDEEAVFEELAGLKTLNDIIGWYDRQRQSTAAGEGAAPAKKALTPLPSSPVEAVESDHDNDPVRCYALKAVAAPIGGDAGEALPDGDLPIVLLGGDPVLSNAFAAALRAEGRVVRQIVPGRETRALGEERFEFDPETLESGDALRGLLGDAAPVAGTILNLADGSRVGPEPGEDNRHAAAKTLFLLCKVLAEDLRRAASDGAGWVINVTALDGRFGLGDAPMAGVEDAGTLGVAKSLARELGELRVKCIDVAPDMVAEDVVDCVLREWRSQDPTVEVGYTPGRERWRLELQAQPPAAASAAPVLDEGAVVLMTGGAYGITAAIAQTVAERYRPRFVIVGRSPLPGEEGEETRGIDDPAALKKVLIGQLRNGRGGKIKPAEVDRALKRLQKDRAIRANLERLRAAGAEVEYQSLDVRDAEAFAGLIDEVYQRYGRIDAVLHGAGVIDDKLIRHKSPESFADVYDTKVVPALVLARKLRPEGLKLVLFFSSIAGRFGNAGQTDYSAANEVLNKLADGLCRAWPGVNVLAIDWGPWHAGMVAEQLLQFYAERGIRPIPVAVGTRHCLAQIERGPAAAAEVVITASLEQVAEQLRVRQAREAANPRTQTAAAA